MRKLALALIAGPVFYVLAGFAGALFPGPVAEVPGARTEVIGLARGPIHYDLLIPLTDATRAEFGFLARDGLPVDHPKARWVVVGWGAEGFYRTVGSYADVTASVAWRAVTGDDAVLRLDLAGDVTGIEGLSWIDASPAQIAALRKAVLAGFARDAAGAPVALPPAEWGEGHLFYRARGRFHLFHTCNAWLGETLRAAGLGFGIWTPTTQAVSLSLWWNRS